MSILGFLSPLASACAVFFGPHGAVADAARRRTTSRQTLYREADRVAQAVDGSAARQQVEALQAEGDALRQRVADLEARLARAVEVTDDRLGEFAATAQAEGVSLPVGRRLLVVFLRALTPSVATLGRLSHAAAQKAAPLLAVLDRASRPRVEQAAADEVFFGPKPCLMVVEQHSLCWLSGRLTEQRTGEEWAKEFGQLPQLRQTTQDGGNALAKGLELVNAQRRQQQQEPIAAQDDHFHVLWQGHVVVRRLHGRVAKGIAQAEAADRKVDKKERQTGARRGEGAATLAWRRAERALDGYADAAAAWAEVQGALTLFTPQGALNTRAAAQAAIEAALPRLSDPLWAKVRRALRRPQLLTFLDAAAAGLAPLPVAPAVLAAAVRVEGLRRQPAATQGAGASAAALRAVLLVANVVLARSGEAGTKALTLVRGVLRGVWRASSLVECLNSVARMQQGRHRKMTQGLLDLKRLYWNCRRFRTGPRRGQTPYGLQGLKLPTEDWWALLKFTPEQLRQHLGLPELPTQELSAPEVAA
jgi:hypothetical protein